ncbi:EF-hand domain-containing protein [Aliidiomarina celeris]|uniref:EF-hand domain-containing protein n=1 Tax=Aliidiomarina celeris TaxID=2249428 RepID=UPI000DEBDEC5|nr:EF-hand domain-containing protein [Aliidiomarina celeris]
MTKFQQTTMAVAVLLAFSGAAMAQEQNRTMWFEHIDTAVAPMPPTPPSPERIREVRTRAWEQQFIEFDLDNDGYVSLPEMTEVMERQARERAEAMFARLDQDGTGMIDLAGFSDGLQGFREERREEARARAREAAARHDEARKRMEVIIERRRDSNGDVHEERRVRAIDD